MKNINILGSYNVKSRISYKPDKKCISCVFFDEGLCWCVYLKKKIDNWEYSIECPIKEIIIEE